ncbi:uncharacterized protein PG998_010552 [Apiospora kogelbergensis]|uniref:uncharacterized protein n=1 Tax=Apiospora kogelbergensis TaxID=1337665 RepID=UPI0031313057
MQFLSLSVLAFASFTLAQNYVEEGMACGNLFGPGNSAKLDSTRKWIVEPSVCESIGGKVEANGIICCPKAGVSTNPYSNKCSSFLGSEVVASAAAGTKNEIVPAGWRCPK